MKTLDRIRQHNYFRGNRAKAVYELLGRRFRNATDWRFMNYGYDFENPADRPDLQAGDQAERYCAQLYHALASQTDLAGKHVLDIGSGRGGGASYMHRYFKPAATIGIDLADSAVAFCAKVYAEIPGLSFQAADAQNLPFGAAEFDIATNVESAHCYPDVARFAAETYRVLKPGGSLLFADFGPTGSSKKTLAHLEAAGFQLITVRDITGNILLGLKQDHDRRSQGIQKRFPRGTRRLAHLWAGTKGSWIFGDFAQEKREYILCHAVKPA
jgi:ubiquinone/menaquinone biosynthesis C-methylase UbiE